MNDGDVLLRLEALIEDLLEVEGLKLSRDSTANDVDGWDSLAHVRIVVAAEQAFSVRFSTGEIASLKTVGDLIDLIKSHRGKE